jgi:hypothetical protein
VPNQVTILGFKEFQTKLAKLPTEIREEADGFVEDAALDWAERAKLDAPFDTGFLAKHITPKPVQQMEWEVISSMFYSPYVEWGTGTRVSVPSELTNYALQFKGKIKVVGRYPHPFFFIQIPIIEKELFNNLNILVHTER